MILSNLKKISIALQFIIGIDFYHIFARNALKSLDKGGYVVH